MCAGKLETSSYHVEFHSQRGRLQSYISKHQDEQYNVVQAIARVYVENLRVCAKGREVYTPAD